VAQILRDEGYSEIGRHVIGTDKHYFWVRGGVDEKNAVKIATQRLEKGIKNLGMDGIYE
jgi:hypothetical protein